MLIRSVKLWQCGQTTPTQRSRSRQVPKRVSRVGVEEWPKPRKAEPVTS